MTSRKKVKPNRASRVEHQGKTMTEKQARRMLDGRIESSPEDYDRPIGSCEARVKIEERQIDRVVNLTAAEWFGL